MKSRVLPLEIVRDHLVTRVGDDAALLDTGSPVTIAPPTLVAEQLDMSIRWLVGTDVMRRRRVVVDWPGQCLRVDCEPLAGEELALTPALGVYQVQVLHNGQRREAFLDTGAPLSYAPASAVHGLTPTATHRDFYPLIGEFDVPVYDLTLVVGRRELRARCGVLPEPLATLLSMVGKSGWILGVDFFRDRVIQLDFAGARMVDATAPDSEAAGDNALSAPAHFTPHPS